MNNISILYAGNRAMAEGIMLSSMSVAKRNPLAKIDIYVLTINLSEFNPSYVPLLEEDVILINQIIKQYNKNANIRLLDKVEVLEENRELFKKLDSHYTPYTLLRLFAHKIKELPNKILYLDCDTMVNNSLEELFSYDITKYAFGAVVDVMGKFWIRKDYFNAGVLLLNLNRIRKLGLFDSALDMVKKRRYFFYDQSVLNILTKKTGHVLYLQDKYNEQRSLKNDTVVKHFCQGIKWVPFFHVYNIKQWEIGKVHHKLKITEFDDIFEEFLKIRNEFREGKYILNISHLVKNYGNLKAVNDISFKVKKGSLFAFLGINGAGKSTTINIICSILKKDSGKVYVSGYDLDKKPDKIKEEIGIVFQNSVLDNDLTVNENLRIRTSFYSMPQKEKNRQLDKIIDLLDLKPILNRPIKKLSGGQKRRVDIARAMVHEPKLLILDEPTTGLDPKTRQSVWALIDEIREKTGMTVFLTTHYLEEADQATFVVIMDKGNIITSGTPTELKNKYSSDYILAYLKKNTDFEKILKQNREKFTYIEDKKAYKILVKNSLRGKLTIDKYSTYIKDFEILKGDMDDVFINVTGRNIIYGENEHE